MKLKNQQVLINFFVRNVGERFKKLTILTINMEEHQIPENPIEKDHKIMKITYYDHCWLNDRQSLEEIKENSKPFVIQEFGYLIKETDKYVVLSSVSYRGETNNWELTGGTVIMKTNIISLKEVKEVEGNGIQ